MKDIAPSSSNDEGGFFVWRQKLSDPSYSCLHLPKKIFLVGDDTFQCRYLVEKIQEKIDPLFWETLTIDDPKHFDINKIIINLMEEQMWLGGQKRLLYIKIRKDGDDFLRRLEHEKEWMDPACQSKSLSLLIRGVSNKAKLSTYQQIRIITVEPPSYLASQAHSPWKTFFEAEYNISIDTDLWRYIGEGHAISLGLPSTLDMLNSKFLELSLVHKEASIQKNKVTLNNFLALSSLTKGVGGKTSSRDVFSFVRFWILRKKKESCKLLPYLFSEPPLKILALIGSQLLEIHTYKVEGQAKKTSSPLSYYKKQLLELEKKISMEELKERLITFSQLEYAFKTGKKNKLVDIIM